MKITVTATLDASGLAVVELTNTGEAPAEKVIDLLAGIVQCGIRVSAKVCLTSPNGDALHSRMVQAVESADAFKTHRDECLMVQEGAPHA